jgi:hypothetical protein
MTSLMAQLNPSTIMMRRKHESGSPCLISLGREKGLEGTPLTKMENRVDEVRLTIQETHEGSKPKERKVDFM